MVEVFCSLCIIRRVVIFLMHEPIGLYDQAVIMAIEINDISSDRVLSSEFETQLLPTSQMPPKNAFSFRAEASVMSRMIEEYTAGLKVKRIFHGARR